MKKPASRKQPSTPDWSVPVEVASVPETGRRLDLVADDAARDAIAKAAGLAALPRLEAGFDLTRHGAEGLRAVGRISATVVQNCVVTLEPIESDIDEAVDLVFLPDFAPATDPVDVQAFEADEPPEAIRDGVIDLGAVTTECLLIGLVRQTQVPAVVMD